MRTRPDMRRYLADLVVGDKRIDTLSTALGESGVDPEDFISQLTSKCGGVWIYLSYILHELIRGDRHPSDIDSLPHGLVAYYLQQIHRWEAVEESWPNTGLRALSILAAIGRPVSRNEIACIGEIDDGEPLRRWRDVDLRPFLDVSMDSNRQRTYAIRHQSLRDLLVIHPGLEDFDGGSREGLNRAVVVAQRQICTYLSPTRPADITAWQKADEYTRFALPGHAAAAGVLDQLTCEPGFLLTVDPPTLLRVRAAAQSQQSASAIGALELALDYFSSHTDISDRIWWLHVWARRTRCDELADRICAGKDWWIRGASINVVRYKS